MIESELKKFMEETKKEVSKRKIILYELNTLKKFEKKAVGLKIGNFVGFLSNDEKKELKKGLQ